MRAILAGCGSMSKEWIRCAEKLGVELVAFVDLNRSAAERCAAAAGLKPGIYTDLGTALQHSNAEMLFDCTVPVAHYEVCSRALEAGLAVLEEKPLALTTKDGAALVRLAAAKNRLHAVMQNRRFNRGVRLVRQEIAAGTIGEVIEVHTDFFIGPHFGGFREEMLHVLLADMAIHTFDAARFLIGSNATSVYCEEWNPVNSWYRHGASALALFNMANGVRFSYTGCWCADGFATSWDASWRVIGREGSLLWDGLNDVRAAVLRSTGKFLNDAEIVTPTHEPDPDLTAGHESVMRQFIRALKGGGPEPETVSSDNFHSLAMVAAAIESAQRGQKVGVEAGEC